MKNEALASAIAFVPQHICNKNVTKTWNIEIWNEMFPEKKHSPGQTNVISEEVRYHSIREKKFKSWWFKGETKTGLVDMTKLITDMKLNT